MRIMRDTITHLARSGYMTVQIPQIGINLPSGNPDPVTGWSEEDLQRVRNAQPDYEEIPDEWILHVHSSSRRLAVTDRERRHAFWFLSRAGFEANREAIRQVFESSQYRRGTWEQFLEEIERRWRDWEEGTERYRANLRRKLAEIGG